MTDLPNISRFAVEFGGVAQARIDRLGLTLERAAERIWGEQREESTLKARVSHLSQCLRGTKGDPSPRTIKAFCDGLDIPFEEIDALRARQREALLAQAKALDVPLGYLSRVAREFGAEDEFRGWKDFEEVLADKAAHYHRIEAELADLRASNPAVGNRIAEAEEKLAAGETEQAEAALADIRDLAEFRALERVREVAKIWTLEADLALSRGDVDRAFEQVRSAADLLQPLAGREALELRREWQNRFWQYGLRYPGAALACSAKLSRRNLEGCSSDDDPDIWAMANNDLGTALQGQGTRTGGSEGAALLGQAVAAYRAALEVRTREAMPAQWAMTHENLAIVFTDMAERVEGAERARRLGQALAAVDGALEVYDPEHMNRYHAEATELRAQFLALMAEGEA